MSQRIVEIDFLDKTRRIWFRYNSMSEFERAFGQSIPATMSNVKNIGFDAVRHLLWAGLIHEDRRLTVERVGDMIEDYLVERDGTLDKVMEAIGKAVTRSGIMGKDPEEGKQEAEAVL